MAEQSPPVSDAALVEGVNALATSFDRLEGAVAANRRLSRPLLALTILMLLVVTAFSIVGIIQNSQIHQTGHETQHIIDQIEAATNPQSPQNQKSAVHVQALFTQLELCIENHEDRVVAILSQKPVPPIPAGCPSSG